MDKRAHVVIMAGGTGTRFWPYSRNNFPKQFLDVLGTGRSLLQMTYDRFKSELPPENIWVVSNDLYENILQEQLPELPKGNFLLEPTKRNTAPCVAYAAYKIRDIDPDAKMIVLPSDHVIFKEEVFIRIVENALRGTDDERLITIGITPNRPETGYGYIQYLTEDQGGLKRVKTFTEKPEMDLAVQFLESGDFVWNAGIFVWSVKSIVSAFEKYQPEMAETFEEGWGLYNTNEEKNFIKRAYSTCKSISIDYAILEKAEQVFVTLGEFGWSDLGSWNALHEIREKDANENVVEADTLLYDCKNNYIISKNDRLVVLHNLEGYLVADFKDVLLVCKKEESGIFRDFVSDVKNEKGEKLI